MKIKLVIECNPARTYEEAVALSYLFCSLRDVLDDHPCANRLLTPLDSICSFYMKEEEKFDEYYG
jgi:hypothetical protein